MTSYEQVMNRVMNRLEIDNYLEITAFLVYHTKVMNRVKTIFDDHIFCVIKFSFFFEHIVKSYEHLPVHNFY